MRPFTVFERIWHIESYAPGFQRLICRQIPTPLAVNLGVFIRS